MAIVTVHWFPLQHAVLVTHPCLRSAIFVFVSLLVLGHTSLPSTNAFIQQDLYLGRHPCPQEKYIRNQFSIYFLLPRFAKICWRGQWQWEEWEQQSGNSRVGTAVEPWNSGNSSGNMSKKVNSDLTCFTVLQISNKKQIFFFAKVNFQFLLLGLQFVYFKMTCG